jgi:hypothetical protein
MYLALKLPQHSSMGFQEPHHMLLLLLLLLGCLQYSMDGDPGGDVSSRPHGMHGANEPPGEKVPAGHL